MFAWVKQDEYDEDDDVRAWRTLTRYLTFEEARWRWWGARWWVSVVGAGARERHLGGEANRSRR